MAVVSAAEVKDRLMIVVRLRATSGRRMSSLQWLAATPVTKRNINGTIAKKKKGRVS